MGEAVRKKVGDSWREGGGGHITMAVIRLWSLAVEPANCAHELMGSRTMDHLAPPQVARQPLPILA